MNQGANVATEIAEDRLPRFITWGIAKRSAGGGLLCQGLF